MSTTMDNLPDGSKTQADRLKEEEEEERSVRWPAASSAHDPACERPGPASVRQGPPLRQGPSKPQGPPENVGGD